MAIDSTATSTLYVGTVVGSSGGIFKTTNGGGMRVPINTGLRAIINAGVLSLALDPRAPSTLHEAIENAGVYKTTDGGAGWVPANGGFPTLGASALAVDPVISDTPRRIDRTPVR
jgi:hypothetical protein